METINNEILVWARLNESLTIDEAAKLLDCSVETLKNYEAGLTVSDSFLEKCSKVYNRPIAVFYLPKPPKRDMISIVSAEISFSDGSVQSISNHKNEPKSESKRNPAGNPAESSAESSAGSSATPGSGSTEHKSGLATSQPGLKAKVSHSGR